MQQAMEHKDEVSIRNQAIQILLQEKGVFSESGEKNVKGVECF